MIFFRGHKECNNFPRQLKNRCRWTHLPKLDTRRWMNDELKTTKICWPLRQEPASSVLMSRILGPICQESFSSARRLMTSWLMKSSEFCHGLISIPFSFFHGIFTTCIPRLYLDSEAFRSLSFRFLKNGPW